MNNEMIKSNEDLIVGKTNYDPMGNMIYDPLLGKLTLWYSVLGAITFGMLCYLIASGMIPIRDFGQFSTAGHGVATFVGAIFGVAIGGLVGSLKGLAHILKQNREKKM